MGPTTGVGGGGDSGGRGGGSGGMVFPTGGEFSVAGFVSTKCLVGRERFVTN